MALSPLANRESRVTNVAKKAAPSKTYALDFDRGDLNGGFIDGEEALRQYISKAIQTSRYRFLIYNDQYGCELESLLGQNISYELLKSELKRVIREALIYDDRIEDVKQFQISQQNDKLFIAFTVVSAEGSIEQEVAIDRV